MNEKLSQKLYQSWMKWNPSMTTRVMTQEECQIQPDFMGFVDIYWHLSKIIPKHFTIVDIGCCYASQSYYFGKHKKYIGIDPGKMERFSIPGSVTYIGKIRDFIKQQMHIEMGLIEERTFAIMSYVPTKDYDYFLAKTTFTNSFIYYPSVDVPKLLRT